MKIAGQSVIAIAIIIATTIVLLRIASTAMSLVQTGISETSVAMISGALTIVTLAVTRTLDRRQEHERALREKKADLYNGLMERMVVIFYHDEDKTMDDKSDELLNFVKDFMPKFILWGGNSSVRAFSKFMVTVRAGSSTVDMLTSTAKLFQALRSEFGHREITLPHDDIMRILITDWDEAMKSKNAENS